MLPEKSKFFTNKGIKQWIFQQDGDKAYGDGGELVDLWNTKHHDIIKLIKYFTFNNPDFSLVSNVWGYVDAKVMAKGCKTFAEWKPTMLHEIKCVTISCMAKIFKSMPKRMRLAFEKGVCVVGY